MIKDIIIAVLWSISPFGEAKVGIPYGMLSGLNIYLVFVLCFLSNVLVFPLMMFFLERMNTYLLRWTFYKKAAIYVARRAKLGSGSKIQKHGFWGLLLFVMIPIPGTGVYAGSIATYLFKVKKRKAFIANSVGIFFSSVIVWVTTLLTMKGIS
ncbi:putative membrane protein [Aquimarina sp. EL_43]|uniref:COG2426 family protein n=1 Tax=Aquimarina TaxID=290174 RepID=UPI00046F6B7D|nr:MULTISPECIES: small multi-drug export protein [Aquimarina]MBG6133348.1 putative membrane protein [Aquimarina sp. EL_35]MBG6153473.1 putative membrane protein [Aquimarina sp. EL_32]MBG6171629.1 putative membrane protein [Aquimarina sp. EL_43]